MLSKDVLKKLKHIEIYTRRLLRGSMVGDSRSALKGSGLEFDQIREYQVGDDVRFIDWNSSARMNKLLVKQYIEERNRTVFLAIDVSASSLFSSNEQLRRDTIAQIGSILAIVADYGKDHVGLLLFSDEIEETMPIARGRTHIRMIMEKLFSYTPRNKKTDVNVAFEYVAKLARRDSIVFCISDFIDHNFEKNLGIVSRMHDVVAIRCLDHNEQAFSSVGFLSIEDNETGLQLVLDTRASEVATVNYALEKRRQALDGVFKKYAVDCIDIINGKPFIGDLIRFFRRRMRY